MIAIRFSKDCEGENEKEEKKKKEEREHMEMFLQHYLPSRFLHKDVDVICPESAGGRVDYFVVQPKIAVEVKWVTDEEHLARLNSGLSNIQRLEKEMEKRDLSHLRNRYIVAVDLRVRLNDNETREVIDELIRKIRKSEQNADENIPEPVRQCIREHPMAYVPRTLNLDLPGGAGQLRISERGLYRPALSFSLPTKITSNFLRGILCEAVNQVLAKANEQLRAIQKRNPSRRIVLLVHRYYHFASLERHYANVFHELHSHISDLYPNIDEIWLQISEREGNYTNHPVFSRDWTPQQLEHELDEMENE